MAAATILDCQVVAPGSGACQIGRRAGLRAVAHDEISRAMARHARCSRGKAMDSPYRSAELDVLLSASRSDRRCSPVAGAGRCRPVTPRARGPFARLAHMSAALFALFVTGAGLVGLAAGINACIMVSAYDARPVMLHAERAPAPRPAASPPRRPKLALAPPVAFDLPAPATGLLAVTEPITHHPGALRSRAQDLERACLPARLLDVALPPWKTPKTA